MHALLAKAAGLLIAPSLFIWGAAGYHVPTVVEFQNLADQKVQQNDPRFGSFSPSGGTTYKLSNSVGLANSSIYLTSFKEPVSNIPYTMTYLGSSIEYGTLAPQSPVSEFVSFTGITQNSDGSAVLTGVSRGLSRSNASSGCVASTTLAQTHPAQTNFILSDSPCLFSEYYVLRNNATSTGILTFTGSIPPRYDNVGAQAGGTYNATTSEFASIAYVNAIAVSGVNNATESVKGIVELATQVEMASSTAIGSTAASLVLQSKYATSSPFTAGRYVPITGVTGQLSPLFISTSSAYTWSALNTYTGGILVTGTGILATASSTINATTTIAASSVTNNALVLNGLPYKFPATRGASSTVLFEDGNGNLNFYTQKIAVIAVGGQVTFGAQALTAIAPTIKIPANTLSSTANVRFRATCQQNNQSGGPGAPNIQINFGNGSATTSGVVGFCNGTGPDFGFVDFDIAATSSSAEVITGVRGTSDVSGGAAGVFQNSSSSFSTAVPLYLNFSVSAGSGGSNGGGVIQNYAVESVTQ